MSKEVILQQLGLTESEVQLYLSLLALGESSASSLANKTSMNRTFVYDRLNRLQQLGMVSYVIKDSKKYFKAANASQLLALVKERETQIREILPELEQLQVETKEPAKIEIFTSKKGVRTVLNGLLKERETILIHGTLRRFESSMPEFYNIWNKQRKRAKIKAKILTNEDIEVPFALVDMLSEEEGSSITTFTAGNKTVNVVWSDVPLAIFIESEEIAKDQKSFFNNLWEREIKIYSGVDGITRAFMECVTPKTKEIVGFGYSWALAQIYGRDFSQRWHDERMKHGIKARLLSYDDNDSKKYFDVRMIEWKDFSIHFGNQTLLGPACVTMSEDVIVTFLYTEKKFRVIVSRNKEMIAVYRKHFETLWKK